MSKKFAINIKCGGFDLSRKAFEHYLDLSGHKDHKVFEEYSFATGVRFSDGSYLYPNDIRRDDPSLIKTVEDLGVEACETEFSRLKIVEVPDDVEVDLCENDNGIEWLAEIHRTWG